MTSDWGEDNRGTGRTSRQMLEAPRDAFYIWPTPYTWYPKSLAQYLGRGDLRVISPESAAHELRVHHADFVIDHAAAGKIPQEVMYLTDGIMARKALKKAIEEAVKHDD